MKAVIILCTIALAAVAYARPEEKYTQKYDNINIDEIIGNTKLFEAYCDCLLDKGKCTAEGKELKSHVTDAMQTDCSKCSEAQRAGADKVFAKLINDLPKVWNELKAKYDPTGKYATKHEAKLTKLKH